MPWYLEYLLLYFAALSLISVIITVYDKIAAKRRSRRISEKTLLIFSLLGGSIFMYLTMQLIRHKTKHFKFMLGIPVIILLQTAVFLFIFFLVR